MYAKIFLTGKSFKISFSYFVQSNSKVELTQQLQHEQHLSRDLTEKMEKLQVSTISTKNIQTVNFLKLFCCYKLTFVTLRSFSLSLLAALKTSHTMFERFVASRSPQRYLYKLLLYAILFVFHFNNLFCCDNSSKLVVDKVKGRLTR